jgi:hypothetical protein
MPYKTASALVTDQGKRVHIRLQGRFYEISQEELRTLLGLPVGSPGLGISIDNGRFCFEFAADDKTVELSARQLERRLAKQISSGT